MAALQQACMQTGLHNWLSAGFLEILHACGLASLLSSNMRRFAAGS
jgi:hypothetical protein